MTFPEIDPVWFHLGPLPVRWYALAYITGIAIGGWHIARLLRQPALWGPGGAPPLAKSSLDDFTTWIVAGVIAGGRLGFLAFYRPDTFLIPFGQWPDVFGVPIWPPLAVWQGGMSFHGGLLGVGVATILFARRRGIAPLAIGDLLACAAPIGLFFGRIANFINAELYGRPTTASVGMVFPTRFDEARDAWLYGPGADHTREAWLATGQAVARHPSQLYEAALEGVLLFVVIRIAVMRGAFQHPGVATGLFLAGYGLSRFAVEFARQPDTYAATLGFLTRGMMLSLPMALLGAFLVWRGTMRQGALA